jgi:hypothetical protein
MMTKEGEENNKIHKEREKSKKERKKVLLFIFHLLSNVSTSSSLSSAKLSPVESLRKISFHLINLIR